MELIKLLKNAIWKNKRINLNSELEQKYYEIDSNIKTVNIKCIVWKRLLNSFYFKKNEQFL